jgi:hypothetical protein
LLDDQNHPGTEDRDVAVVMLESIDCGLVSVRDRVQRFPALDSMPDYGYLRLGISRRIRSVLLVGALLGFLTVS